MKIVGAVRKKVTAPGEKNPPHALARVAIISGYLLFFCAK